MKATYEITICRLGRGNDGRHLATYHTLASTILAAARRAERFLRRHKGTKRFVQSIMCVGVIDE